MFYHSTRKVKHPSFYSMNDIDSKTDHVFTCLFFTPNDTTITDMIMNVPIHYGNVNKKQMNQTMITDAIRKCDFGFISFTERSYIEQSTSRKLAEYIVHGFILCQRQHASIFLSLICVPEHDKKVGPELLSSVIKYTESNPEILRVTLYALPELQTYYQNHIFDVIDTLRTHSGEIKMFQMSYNTQIKYGEVSK
jgi:hypothetical protein